jgi:hypothetical protein
VIIRYSSDTQVVAVMVSIADDVFAALTDLASDNGFVPYDVTFLSLRDLASQISVSPVFPVLLRWVDDVLDGIQRFLRLWFSTNRLTRLMLSVRYADVSGRQITPQVQLVQMDIVFDLVDSCDVDATKRQITGYVYGSFQFGSVQAVASRPRFGGDSQAFSWYRPAGKIQLDRNQLGRDQLERLSWTGTSSTERVFLCV